MRTIIKKDYSQIFTFIDNECRDLRESGSMLLQLQTNGYVKTQRPAVGLPAYGKGKIFSDLKAISDGDSIFS